MREDKGVEAIIGFIIAIGIFVLVFAVVIFAIRTSVPPDTGKTDLQSKANQALNILVTTPGVPENWDRGPDNVQRLGLTETSTSNLISSSKLNCMSDASLESSANGRLDYAEAKNALGMKGYDFHIRTYPVFPQSAYGTAGISDIRVAYIGNYGSVVNPPSLLWDQSETSESKDESGAISNLGARFTNVLYIPPLIRLPPLPPIGEREGDKFADVSDYIQNNLVPRLDNNSYQILVVGSNVDQTALTPAAVKGAIARWVRAGGKLIVLGGQQNANWLEPFLTTGTRGASGGVYIPDTGHPILSVPNRLRYTEYPDPGRTWVVPNETYSHIITKGPAPGQMGKMMDVLAVSNPGALDDKGNKIFGNGTVILTTYLPYDIGSRLGIDEERKFFTNAFMYVAHRTVYLDYGPAVPSGVDVAYSERISLVNYPGFGTIETRFVIYVWQGI